MDWLDGYDWFGFFAIGAFILYWGVVAVAAIEVNAETRMAKRIRKARLTSRPSFSCNDFIKYFEARGVAPIVAEKVWTVLNRSYYARPYSPHPDDAFREHEIIEETDWEAMIREVLLVLRCPKGKDPLDFSKVYTVADLVMFVDTLPRRSHLDPV